jgi:hypothetical protein
VSGTNASMDAEDETKAIHATVIIVNLIFIILLKVPYSLEKMDLKTLV